MFDLTRLSIVRGVGFRDFDINFFQHCKNIDITLIHSLPTLKTNLKSIKLREYPVFSVDPISIFKKNHALLSLTSWTYLENLEAQLRQTDVICTLEPYFFISQQCAKISKRLSIPLVVTTAQNLQYHPSRFLPPYSWNSNTVLKRADLFITMTYRSKIYVKALGVPEEKIAVIQPGVDLHKFYPTQKNHQTPRILFVGNLFSSKGISELLFTSAKLIRDGFSHELWICGTGNLQRLVNKFAFKYPIKALGFIDYQKMPEIYRQCDIFCLPSRDYSIMGVKIGEEQFGFVFLEAMSSALPIVTTNTGSISEVVGSRNYLVKKGSNKELYFALRELICDENLRRLIGTSNRNRVENLFDIKKQSLKFEKEIYKVSTRIK